MAKKSKKTKVTKKQMKNAIKVGAVTAGVAVVSAGIGAVIGAKIEKSNAMKECLDCLCCEMYCEGVCDCDECRGEE